MGKLRDLVDQLYVVSFIQTHETFIYDENIVAITTFDKVIEIVESRKEEINAEEVCYGYNDQLDEDSDCQIEEPEEFNIDDLIHHVKITGNVVILSLLLNEINHDLECLHSYLSRKKI